MLENKKVKFDGKHWIAKRTRDGPLRCNYEHVAEQAAKKLDGE